MLNVQEMIRLENRRLAVLAKLNEAGRVGYRIAGDEPEYWREILLGLNNDMLAYPAPTPGLAGFTWFISDAGKAALKAVRK